MCLPLLETNLGHFGDYESFLELAFVVNTLHALWNGMMERYAQLGLAARERHETILRNTAAGEPRTRANILGHHKRQKAFRESALKWAQSLGFLCAAIILATLFYVRSDEPITPLLWWGIVVLGWGVIALVVFVILINNLWGRLIEATVKRRILAWASRVPPSPPSDNSNSLTLKNTRTN